MKKLFLFLGITLMLFIYGCTSETEEATPNYNSQKLKDEIMEMAEDYGLRIHINEEEFKKINPSAFSMKELEKEFQMVAKAKGKYQLTINTVGNEKKALQSKTKMSKRRLLRNGETTQTDNSYNFTGIEDRTVNGETINCFFFATWQKEDSTEHIKPSSVQSYGSINCTKTLSIDLQSHTHEIDEDSCGFNADGFIYFSFGTTPTYLEYNLSYMATCKSNGEGNVTWY